MTARTSAAPTSHEGALTSARLESAIVAGEFVRIDGKTNTTLALGLGMLTAVAALILAGPRLAPAGQALAWVAAFALVAAVALLLLAVRPSLPRTGGFGFVAHARARDADELARMLAARPASDETAELLRLSRMVRAKYRLIRRAVTLMLLALLALAAAVPLGTWTA